MESPLAVDGIPLVRNHRNTLLTVLLLTSSLAALSGCGGNPSSSSGSGTGPVTGEFTTVAIQASSTANAQFVRFGMTINSIALTNNAGVKTTIFNTPTDVEFISLNQSAEPLAVVKVPQGVYTSAAVSMANPSFTYIFMAASGSITTSTDAYGNGYPPNATVVNLSGPITVEGSTMGLLLTLDAAKSAAIQGYPRQTGYSISPTFNLSSFSIGSATTAEAAKSTGLLGQVASIDKGGQSATITLHGAYFTGTPTLSVALNSATAFQGISAAGDLKVGMLVTLDAAVQPDTSYAASRIAVYDPAATDVAVGQLTDVYPSYGGYVITDAVEQAGTNLFVQPLGMGAPYMYGSSAAFQISSPATGLDQLPFTPDFSAASIVSGQRVALGSTTLSLRYPYTTPTTVTLLPQTIDATVTAQSTAGNYQVYSAMLAPYDLIVQMNTPPAGTPGRYLANPNAVQVYVGPGAAMHATAAPASGGTFRFHGLLFNDGGVLRMVADRVDDGVPQ